MMKLKEFEHEDLINLVVGKAFTSASIVRSALELIWPAWKEANNHPIGETISEGCCVHSAFLLAGELARDVSEFQWKVVGGMPSSEKSKSGYLNNDDEFWMHMWVHGSFQDRPGEPLIIADITADQFGMPSVLVDKYPLYRYRQNMSYTHIEKLRWHEKDFLEMVSPLIEQARRLV